MLVRNDTRNSGLVGSVDRIEDDEIDLLALLGTLWRGKFLILGIALISLALGVYYAVEVAEERFTASTTLTVQENGASVIDLESVVPGFSSESEALNTELEVLRSRGLLERLVAKLDLTNDPEFNGSLVPTSILSVGGFIEALNRWRGIEPEQSSETKILNDAVNALGESLSASVKRDTFVITLSVTSGDPEKSQLIANTIAELYLEDQVKVKFDTMDQAVTWLSARVVELEEEIQTRDDAFKEQSAAADFVNPEGLELMNRQVRELRERLIGEENDASQVVANFAQLQNAVAAKQTDMVLEITRDPTLQRLNRLNATDQLWVSGGAFEARVDALLSRARTDVTRAQTQVTALENSISAMESRVTQQAEKLSELQQMRRELDTISILYETFLTRLRETTIQQGIQTANARVLSKAVPGERVAPRSSMIAALSLVLGLMLGIGLVLLREFRENGYRSADELQDSTGLNVIGQIPMFPVAARSDMIAYMRNKPTSAAVEAVRNLRTSILLSDIDQPPQVIMSTSTVPGEGKTTQSVALTQNLSGLGKKVLLVEGDIRRRTLDEYFRQEANEHGVVSVISGAVPLSEAAFHSDRLGADVLIGEQTTENAADVFSSKKFANFIEAVRKEYDFVIIDTPPVLVVPDARVIGQHCDAIVYNVKWDATKKGQVVAGLNELRAVKLNISGLVLAQIDPKGMKRYGYGENYGAYSAYGKGYYDA